MAPRPLLLFDGTCALCSRSVRWVRARDKRDQFEYLPLGSERAAAALNGAGHAGPIPDSLVLIDGFGVHFYSAAVLAVIRHLPYPWPLLRIVGWIPKFIRDGVYRFIASNRHRRFGKRSGTHPGT